MESEIKFNLDGKEVEFSRDFIEVLKEISEWTEKNIRVGQSLLDAKGLDDLDEKDRNVIYKIWRNEEERLRKEVKLDCKAIEEVTGEVLRALPFNSFNGGELR